VPNWTTVTVSSLILMLNCAQFIYLCKWQTFQSWVSLHINETEWPQFTAHTTHFLKMYYFWDKTRTEKIQVLFHAQNCVRSTVWEHSSLTADLHSLWLNFVWDVMKLYLPGLNDHTWLNFLCSIWLFKFLVCMIQKLNNINYSL
jgi:hypothetical protein